MFVWVSKAHKQDGYMMAIWDGTWSIPGTWEAKEAKKPKKAKELNLITAGLLRSINDEAIGAKRLAGLFTPTF